MTQIAKAAGLTKGAIYFYYKDKADLLRMALENANAQTFLPVAQQIRQSDRTPTTRLVQFSNAVARLGVDRREELLLPVLMGAEFAGSGAAAEAQILEMYEVLTDTLEALIVEGQAGGEFCANLMPRTTAITLVALVDGLLLQWHRLRGAVDGGQLATTAREMILRSVRPI